MGPALSASTLWGLLRRKRASSAVPVPETGPARAAGEAPKEALDHGPPPNGSLPPDTETARAKRREDALRRIEAHYLAFILEAPIGIFRSSPKGQLLSANRKLARIAGYETPEDMMAAVTDIASQLYADPADRARVMDMAISRNIVKNLEIRFLRRDGAPVWVSLHVRAVRDDAGRLDHFDGFATDVTERRQAQEALAASEHMLRHIVRWVRDVIYRLDPDGRIIFISPAITRFGYREEELIGRDIFDIVHPEDQGRCQRRLNERRTGARRTTGLELRLVRKGRAVNGLEAEDDGKAEDPVFRLESEGVYEDDGQGGQRFLGTVGIAPDIKRRRLAEERLKRSLREKELLLREIQHRVKNNLQMVSSLLELTAARVRTPEALDVCLKVQGYVRSIGLIHSQLSRQDSAESVDMAEFTRGLFASAATLYHQARINPVFCLEDVRLHLDKALPCGMLLNELLTNAFKHAFPEGETGTLRIELASLEDGRILLRVRDDGVGIPLDAAPDKAGSMGMKLVRSLASQLRAELSISGAGGVEVSVTFPAGAPRDRLAVPD